MISDLKAISTSVFLVTPEEYYILFEKSKYDWASISILSYLKQDW